MKPEERIPEGMELDPALDHVSRRQFLGAAGASAGLLSVAIEQVRAQDTSERVAQDPAIVTREVRFPSRGAEKTDTIQGFLATPESGGKRGSVIVVFEIFGLNDHIRDITARLARAGFNALAVDFFSREGGAPRTEGGNFQPLMQFVSQIPDRQILQDVRAATTYLKGLPISNGRVGTVGFCWGGRIVMLAAAQVPELAAAVAYYGRIRSAKTENQPVHPMDLVDQIRVPLLGHFGAEDRGIPVADVEALRDRLKERGALAELHLYPGAGHAFNNDTRPGYQKEAATAAWKRTLDWFRKHLS